MVTGFGSVAGAAAARAGAVAVAAVVGGDEAGDVATDEPAAAAGAVTAGRVVGAVVGVDADGASADAQAAAKTANGTAVNTHRHRLATRCAPIRRPYPRHPRPQGQPRPHRGQNLTAMRTNCPRPPDPGRALGRTSTPHPRTAHGDKTRAEPRAEPDRHTHLPPATPPRAEPHRYAHELPPPTRAGPDRGQNLTASCSFCPRRGSEQRRGEGS